MASRSDISWTGLTWNPVSGCTRASRGCDHCWAVKMTHRLELMGQADKYGGLTSVNGKGDRHFNGVVRCHPGALMDPVRWKSHQLIFVCSMADLFHPAVPFEFVDSVVAVMAMCPHHTFQVLTKRADRMREYFAERHPLWQLHHALAADVDRSHPIHRVAEAAKSNPYSLMVSTPWPLPNVWWGVTAEDQEQADRRIRDLAECPGAVRWISYEPALERVDFPLIRIRLLRDVYSDPPAPRMVARAGEHRGYVNRHGAVSVRSQTGELLGLHLDEFERLPNDMHWLVCGGESYGRPFDVEWPDYVLGQCRAAGVAFFMKQLGTFPVASESAWGRWTPAPVLNASPTKRATLKELGMEGVVPLQVAGKGEDFERWPRVLQRHLAVREWPEVGTRG